MSWTHLYDLSSEEFKTIEEGKPKHIRKKGLDLCLIKENGEIRILKDQCPHAQASLSAGFMENGSIVCPSHHYKFDIKTGIECTGKEFQLRSFETKQEDNALWVDLPNYLN